MEQVAAEPRGRVDDHRVEAPRILLLGLAQQLRPPGTIVASPGLLVGELADDLARPAPRPSSRKPPAARERRASGPACPWSRAARTRQSAARRPQPTGTASQQPSDRLLDRLTAIANPLCRAYPESPKIGQPSRSQQARRVGTRSKNHQSGSEAWRRSDASTNRRYQRPVTEAKPGDADRMGGVCSRRCAPGR